MAFFTRNNLKVRLDEEALFPVIFPLRAIGVYDEVLLDLELWERMPDSLSNVAALATALLTGSWVYTLIAFICGFYFGVLIQELIYSDFLRRIFPLFLGSWMIDLPAAIVICFVLYKQGQLAAGILAGTLIIGNWIGITSILLLFSSPLSVLFIKLTGVGGVERAFIRICNNRAREHGIELDWDSYDQRMKPRRSIDDIPM